MLELYGAKTGNCLRAAVGLSEAGLTYEVRQMDLRSGEHRNAAHLALNPAGKVPVLVVDSDVVITQSSAILFYASEQAPGRLLPPPGSLSRIKALEAFFHFTSDVIAANGFAFNLRTQGNFDTAVDALTQRSVDALLGSERFLTDAGYMGADTFSMADIAGFTITTAVSKSLPWEKLPRLAAWRDRIAQRPAVQQAMTVFDRV
ncbi:MAG TPA: glutathione S-transferase family protein [Steroidobacteraceae bacterium]